MSELKATPGPWVWNEDRFHGGWSGLFGANDLPVIYPQRENDGDEGAAWFASEDDSGEEGLSDADRNLIAAAPELLAACEAAEWNSLDLPDFVVNQLRAALAKARGKHD